MSVFQECPMELCRRRRKHFLKSYIGQLFDLWIDSLYYIRINRSTEMLLCVHSEKVNNSKSYGMNVFSLY